MTLFPRSLTGQIAALIAVALFVAQAVNLALLIGERRELRFEQAIRPAVVRLTDAAERVAAGRALPGSDRPEANRRNRGRAQLFNGNPIPAGLARVTDVEHAVATEFRDAGIAHGRIVSGVGPIPDDDPRLRRLDPRGIERVRERQGLLQVAVELSGKGWLSVRTGWPRTHWGLVWRLIAQTLVLYGIILVPVLWLSRRIARPLGALTVAARGFGRGGADNGAALVPSGPADVRALTAAFNGLRERVGGMLDEKDRMLGAIGHDLRTPLAALRVRIESVEDDTDRNRMADTIDEMSRMLDDILSLARIGRPSEPATEVDLGALVDAVVEDFRDLGAPVEMADAARVVRIVRPGLMRRAVRNLIENAVKYGGSAEVSVTSDAQAVRICVADRGPGIPADKLAQAFESFTRLDESRNRDTGGVGLGLALARGIVREAGGEIALRNRDGGGLAAEIVLPGRL